MTVASINVFRDGLLCFCLAIRPRVFQSVPNVNPFSWKGYGFRRNSNASARAIVSAPHLWNDLQRARTRNFWISWDIMSYLWSPQSFLTLPGQLRAIKESKRGSIPYNFHYLAYRRSHFCRKQLEFFSPPLRMISLLEGIFAPRNSPHVSLSRTGTPWHGGRCYTHL